MKKCIFRLLISMLAVTLLLCLSSCNFIGGKIFCQHRDKDDDSLCDKCDKSYTDGKDVIPEGDHTHAYSEWTKYGTNSNVSCEEQMFLRSCSLCGDIEWKYGGYDNHRFESEIIPPTCATKGYEKRICLLCGFSETINYTETSEHTYKNEYAYDELTHWKTCKYCGVTGYFENHTFDESSYCSVCMQNPLTDGMLFQISSDGAYATLTKYQGDATEVIIPAEYRGVPVTKIADKAFTNNKKLTSVVIGENVKTIGKNAFAKCTALESVTIPESVTSIGEYAFQNCKKLTSVTIPNGVTSIESSTFSWCVALNSVTIGNKVASIADNAFAECAELTSIVIPDSVKTIGEYAFSNCAKLSSVTLGNGMESLDKYVFYNCQALTSLNLGNSLKTIGECAFQECRALETLVVPDSLTTISAAAFANCEALANITLGAGLTQIGISAFYGTIPHRIARGDIADPSLGAGAEPVKQDIFYIGNWLIASLNSEIPAFTVKEGTVGIADNAFQSCKSLGNISIPNVKYIGNASFAFCDKLRNVYDASDVLVINDYAFYECAALVNVDRAVELKVEKIGISAFENCYCLKDEGIQIPAYPTLKYLGENAFLGTLPFKYATAAEPIVCLDSWVVGFREGGVYMSQVDVPDVNKSNGKPITAIGNYAFNKAVFEGGGVWISNNVVYIGRGAFYNLYMMGGVGGAANLEYIDDYAFYGCAGAYFFANAEERGVVQLPTGLKYIGRSAFYGCTSIIGVKFPANVEYIGPYAFYGCSNLGDSGEIYGSAEEFEEGRPPLKGPVVFALDSRIKYIGDSAFENCTGIKEIVLPASLEYLGNRAFYQCTNLEKLVISDGVKSIGDFAFLGCTSLTKVEIPDSVSKIGANVFESYVYITYVNNIGDEEA